MKAGGTPKGLKPGGGEGTSAHAPAAGRMVATPDMPARAAPARLTHE